MSGTGKSAALQEPGERGHRVVDTTPTVEPVGRPISGTVTTRPCGQKLSDLAGIRLVSIPLVVAVAVLAAALLVLAMGMASSTATLGSYRPKVAA
jgi:hypothetical protein